MPNYKIELSAFNQIDIFMKIRIFSPFFWKYFEKMHYEVQLLSSLEQRGGDIKTFVTFLCLNINTIYAAISFFISIYIFHVIQELLLVIHSLSPFLCYKNLSLGFFGSLKYNWDMLYKSRWQMFVVKLPGIHAVYNNVLHQLTA